MLRQSGLVVALLLGACGGAVVPRPPIPPAPDAAPALDAAPGPVDAAPAPSDSLAADLTLPQPLDAVQDLARAPDAAAPLDAASPPVDLAPDRAPDAPPVTTPPSAPGLYFVLRAGGVPTTLPATVNGITVEQAVLLLHELYLAADVGGAYLAARPADFSAPVVIALPVLRPGLYSRLQIKLEAESEGGGLPPVLMGRAASIFVSGKTAAGAPFVIRDTAESQTGVVASTPRDLKTGERLRATVSYDLERWFAGVELGSGGAVDSGQLARFRSNVMQSAALDLD
jgi:hypothetical protein